MGWLGTRKVSGMASEHRGSEERLSLLKQHFVMCDLVESVFVSSSLLT